MEACIEEGATTEAAKYIAKTMDPEERAKVGGPLEGGTNKKFKTHDLVCFETCVSRRVFHIKDN